MPTLVLVVEAFQSIIPVTFAHLSALTLDLEFIVLLLNLKIVK